MDSCGTIGIRAVEGRDREWVVRILTENWGEPRIISRGKENFADRLPAFLAHIHGTPAGLLTYRIEHDECEVVSLNSRCENHGIGAALLGAVEHTARTARCRRVWLITTNDNIRALRFYQKRGWALVAVHRNALDESRRLKPSIPEIGLEGIPLRDEIEFERVL